MKNETVLMMASGLNEGEFLLCLRARETKGSRVRPTYPSAFSRSPSGRVCAVAVRTCARGRAAGGDAMSFNGSLLTLGLHALIGVVGVCEAGGCWLFGLSGPRRQHRPDVNPHGAVLIMNHSASGGALGACAPRIIHCKSVAADCGELNI